MSYKSLQECIDDLDKHGMLIRIKEEVNPDLEMAAIHLRVHEAKGGAILYENIKGTKFKAVSNLFGTTERSRFIFRDTLKTVEQLITIKNNPSEALKDPFKYINSISGAIHSLPLKDSMKPPVMYAETTIDKLPQIKHWKQDGGAFITLPQVYTEDINTPGIKHSNLGMYRIQMSGNDYILNEEVGLHYQLHRGIGVHQSKSEAKNLPLKVSIFIGGPPAHTFAAVMPLPEGMSELNFAGVLANRRFRYCYDKNGNFISNDADFVITGEVLPGAVKAEGPFGDHLGYYSLKHPFPVMKVHKVYHRKNAIWAFTVVGRPPQEDTAFGAMIHEITGAALPATIPGLYAVNAVDAAGVHPLLFAIGSERYTPYIKERKPQEILTIANHILGFGQMSLAKYLFIAAKEDNPNLDINNINDFLIHILERVDFTRDLHFHTNTTIDTLDYSGTSINSGSKVVIAAAGNKLRTLTTTLPSTLNLPNNFIHPVLVMPGVIAITAKQFTDYNTVIKDINNLTENLKQNNIDSLKGVMLIVICDDSDFVAKTINNFVWVCFTRSNPAQDIYGVDSYTTYKHWGCNGSLIIDARKKPHHAPELVKDEATEKMMDILGTKGHSLHGIL